MCSVCVCVCVGQLLWQLLQLWATVNCCCCCCCCNKMIVSFAAHLSSSQATQTTSSQPSSPQVLKQQVQLTVGVATGTPLQCLSSQTQTQLQLNSTQYNAMVISCLTQNSKSSVLITSSPSYSAGATTVLRSIIVKHSGGRLGLLGKRRVANTCCVRSTHYLIHVVMPT